MLRPSYTRLMEGEGAHVRLKLDTSEPIALGDFVGNFVGIGSQFEKFVAREYPDLKADSEFFVKDVRDGCIEADLVAWVFGPMGAGAFLAVAHGIEIADKVRILTEFVTSTKGRLSKYFKRGGRDETASKSDLADFTKTISAIAHAPNGSVQLEAAYFHDGQRQVTAAFKFTTGEAREAEQQLLEHQAELEATTAADHKHVLMRFVRPSIEPSKTHKPTGQRAIIESVYPKSLPVIYASDLARQRIEHEMRQGEANIFRLLFDVDANVVLSNERPAAFRIVAVHDVIDAPDEGSEP